MFLSWPCSSRMPELLHQTPASPPALQVSAVMLSAPGLQQLAGSPPAPAEVPAWLLGQQSPPGALLCVQPHPTLWIPAGGRPAAGTHSTPCPLLRHTRSKLSLCLRALLAMSLQVQLLIFLRLPAGKEKAERALKLFYLSLRTFPLGLANLARLSQTLKLGSAEKSLRHPEFMI